MEQTDGKSTEKGGSRRDRIVVAALEVIRLRGVDGLTHRAVASQAETSLGLTTYYFAGIEEILEAAFDLAMQRDVTFLTAWADSLGEGADLVEALTDLVYKLGERESESVYVNFVLVLAAVHRPHLQTKAHAWANSLTHIMERCLSPEAAASVATVYDGTLLRQAISGNLGRRHDVEAGFRRACADESVWHVIG
jgi:DNA-binding transcriptional regulator YbjK